MADQEEEDLLTSLGLYMQDNKSSELEKVQSSGNFGVEDKCTPPEVENRVTQQNLLAAGAEKSVESATDTEGLDEGGEGVSMEKGTGESGTSEMKLPAPEATQLFSVIFGERVGQNVLAQWTNQGIRFSDDPETSMGLVQHEAGPCGVLAALQGFVLKYLIFSPEEPNDIVSNSSPSLTVMGAFKNDESMGADIFLTLSEEKKSRALVRSMCEILFLCGSNETAVIASLDIPELLEGISAESTSSVSKDEVIAKLLEGISVECGSDLQKVLRIHTCTSRSSLVQKLEDLLPVFRSRMGAFLFLVSALLSRGLDAVEGDRDDPSHPPLVTPPFGHASQEIVNLLLSGRAVANVFDGEIDMGGGLVVKGISTPVEVGFLTLLETLDFCKVGDHLKCPKWPIWVVGSETHYTVLFALDNKIQDEAKRREALIRRAFYGQDQSVGGGIVDVDGFRRVVNETGVNFPAEKTRLFCRSEYIVWGEFWEAVMDLERDEGGMKGLSAGEKDFELYHFNGISKSVGSGGVIRPRLTRLKVSLPFEDDVAGLGMGGLSIKDNNSIWREFVGLVDCVRTRWPLAVCNWEGDAPSIV